MMFGKGMPKAWERAIRAKRDKREVEAIKRQVRARDHFTCRCCNRKDQIDTHEHKRRGAGGEVSLTNSFTLCRACHSLIQTRHIQVEMADGLKTFDANHPLRFVVPKDIADTLFRKYIPPQVSVEES